MRNFELSEQAQLRLKEIADYYILHESLERTIKVLNSFEDAFTIISNNPFLYIRNTIRRNLSEWISGYIFITKPTTFIISFSESIKISEIFQIKQHPGRIKIGL